MNEVTVNGILLSVMPMGEYDRRVEILTAEFGRISAFAKGARKPGSSLVSVTRAFAFGVFHLLQGSSSYILKNAEITDYFEELSKDVEIASYGFYFLEMAQYFSRENVEAANMLKLLFYSLKALTRSSVPNRLVKAVYELKMLDLNGLCPALDRLLSGSGVYAFAMQMSDDCKRAYQHVLAAPVSKQYTFLLSETVQEEFEGIVQHLVRQNTDRQFKSLNLILKQV